MSLVVQGISNRIGAAVVTSLVDEDGAANDAGSPLMTVPGLAVDSSATAAANNVLRPTVEPEAADAEIIRMMTKCWAEDPLLRPDFSALKVTIRRLNRFVCVGGSISLSEMSVLVLSCRHLIPTTN